VAARSKEGFRFLLTDSALSQNDLRASRSERSGARRS
jgi:hypothetical protein